MFWGWGGPWAGGGLRVEFRAQGLCFWAWDLFCALGHSIAQCSSFLDLSLAAIVQFKPGTFNPEAWSGILDLLLGLGFRVYGWPSSLLKRFR